MHRDRTHGARCSWSGAWPDPTSTNGRVTPGRFTRRSSTRHKRALMLGMDDRTHGKLGATPAFADCLKPMAISVQQFLATLHCLLPVNGGIAKTGPARDSKRWRPESRSSRNTTGAARKMIEHGVTGFLGSDDCELAHYAAILAHDEALRLRVIEAARQRLVTELANPAKIWAGWQRLFDSLSTEST